MSRQLHQFDEFQSQQSSNVESTVLNGEINLFSYY
jgi:hypothetical protein